MFRSRKAKLEDSELEDVMGLESCYRTLDYLGIENLTQGSIKFSMVVEVTHQLINIEVPRIEEVEDIVESVMEDILEEGEEISIDAFELIPHSKNYNVYGFSRETKFVVEANDKVDTNIWGRLIIPTQDGIHTLRVGELTEVIVNNTDGYTKSAEVVLRHEDTPEIKFNIELNTWVDSDVLAEEFYKAYVTAILFYESFNFNITDIFKRELSKYVAKKSQTGVDRFSLKLNLKS